jgi:alpha-mannosidase
MTVEPVDVAKRTFSTAMQLMNEYPDYTYTQSGVVCNSWMADKEKAAIGRAHSDAPW